MPTNNLWPAAGRRAVATAVALAAAAFTMGAAPALAQTAPAPAPRPEYKVIEDTPATGTRIRSREVASSPIARNLDYHDLPPADRARLHGWWEAIAEGDEPPFPLGGMKVYFDPLGVVAQKLDVSGELFAVGLVGADGRVVRVDVMQSPSREFAEIAAKGLMLTRFKPARCGGQPCAMEFPVRLKVDRVLR